jgi:hypothetical protein
MLQWFADNAGTLAVSLALIALVALIVRSLRKDRRKGRHLCGGQCGGCPMAGKCHKA